MSSTRFGWFNIRPNSLQCFNTSRWLLAFLCLFYFCLSMVINGTYSVSVSTIEKRFGLSSSTMGIVTSMYDVACLFVTVFVSYYGGQQSKSRWLGWALFILGISNFVFILPHLIIGKYEAGEKQLPDVCAVNATDKDVCDNKALGKWYYPAIFCFGMFLIGIAGAPLYVLGVAYLDESVKKKIAPIYIGFFGSSGTVGSACGFLLGGIFLSFYVDTGTTTELTVNDPRWVGNWWIGNVIGIVMAILLSVWMLGFPRKIGRKYSLGSENNGSDESHVFQFSETMSHMDIKKLPTVTRELFSIPGYIFLCFGSALEYFVITAAMAFFPKVIYVLFSTPLSELSWLYGTAVVLPILAGQILGAYINKRMELNGIQATKTVCITTFISMIVGLLYLTTQCSGQEVVGLTLPVGNRTNELISDCNVNCDCTNWLYFPVCDTQRKTTYRSPCIARCTTKQEDKMVFTGCRCSSSEELAYGKCPSKCGVKAAIFVLLTALFGFTSFLAQTPTVIAILRSVPDRLKAYALGWQMIFIRLLGAIPGPIIYGKLIDTTCILWQDKCGSRGNCLEYDNEKLINVTAAVATISKFFTTLFFMLAWKFLKPLPPTVEVNGNGGVDYRMPESSDTTPIRSDNV